MEDLVLKKANASKKLCCIYCQVTEETFGVIDELSRDCGISTGEVIDIIVDSYVEMCNKDGQ